MKAMRCWTPAAVQVVMLVVTLLASNVTNAQHEPRVARRLPPAGMAWNDQQQKQADQLQTRLEKLRAAAASIEHQQLPDASVLLKAVDLALVHNEFYRAGDFKTAEELLDLADQRLQSLSSGAAPWASKKQRGLLVRGYRSSVDGSVQPYGLEIPADYDPTSPSPLLIWLHGRGDKTTDLHFIAQRMRRPGQAQLPGAIVVHPFGRQCVGFKSAGETDVLEVVDHVKRQYNIDRNRVVLMGFSMGGAGGWHLGAHFADRWVAVSPGAGFAETRRYNRLKDDQLPNPIEQRLWGQYDVPGYVRNLFNVPVIAYSGELDKQIQAARVMEEAYKQQGRTLPHRIGPGMGHKYHPEVLKSLLKEIQAAAAKGRNPAPREVHLQTRTLRYSRMFWVQALQLKEHWRDSRVDAIWKDNTTITAQTTNIQRVRFDPWRTKGQAPKEVTITIDGQQLTASPADGGVVLQRHKQQWKVAEAEIEGVKEPGLQGPIDDAFVESFLIVRPNAVDPQQATCEDRWAAAECQHFQARWKALMRGTARVKDARDLTEDDLKRHHLVLFGTPSSNPWIKKVLATQRLPLSWNSKSLTFNGREYGPCHVPQLIYPNPLAPDRYVVLNSGLTFREGHDRTNSLQNPKLGDWVVLDVRHAATELAPAKIVSHGLFDEHWK